MKHSYTFAYKTTLPNRQRLTGTWSIVEASVAEAKVKLKAHIARKYKNLPFEFALVTVDNKTSKSNKTKSKRFSVRALGVPSKVDEGGTTWDRVMRNRPDLLRFAKFAIINPSGVVLEIKPKGSDGEGDSFMRFVVSRLKWDPVSDSVTGFDVDGDAVFRWQLQYMPEWISRARVIWNTIELVVNNKVQAKRNVVKVLTFNFQSNRATSNLSAAQKQSLRASTPVATKTSGMSQTKSTSRDMEEQHKMIVKDVVEWIKKNEVEYPGREFVNEFIDLHVNNTESYETNRDEVIINLAAEVESNPEAFGIMVDDSEDESQQSLY